MWKKKWKGEKDSNLSNPYSFSLIYYQTENSFAQPTGKKKKKMVSVTIVYTHCISKPIKNNSEEKENVEALNPCVCVMSV